MCTEQSKGAVMREMEQCVASTLTGHGVCVYAEQSKGAVMCEMEQCVASTLTGHGGCVQSSPRWL